jgi:NADPH-dependent 2,4-dienoyl-CoA reductase/sulfur reductase-like enzyme/rhodanese-related sulfurtransferase
VYNVIIIGGMAAGCKAAARLSRLSSNYQVTIIEKSSFISFSSCGLPLFASGELNDLSELTSTSYGVVRDEKYFCEVKGVKVLTQTEVKSIDPWEREVECFDIRKSDSIKLQYDYLIIATGSQIIKPAFQIESSPLISPFHSPADAKKFRQAVQQGNINKAVIVGAGFIGCELAEALTSMWGIETILIDKEDSLLPGCLDKEISAFAENIIKSDKILTLLSTRINRIETDANGYPVVFLDNGQKIVSDYVFYCLGVKPNTEIAKKINIKTGSRGGIIVDDQMRTSIPDIWAAGDCVELPHLVTGQTENFSYGSLANRMGRVAADSIIGRKSSLKGTAGTLSLKIFDSTISATGITEKKARQCGYSTGSVIGCWSDRPDYYPDAKNLIGKLVYEKPGLRLLGLQLIGEGETTRYLDVFSILLSNQKTVYDLLEVEHGYTPAHSSPISPLNNLGSIALNQEKDEIINYNPLLFSFFKGTCIDVREPDEIKMHPFTEDSLQIPLSQLRPKLIDFKNQFGENFPFMLVCEKGPRSYEAARMFANAGFKNVSYLAGGNYLFSTFSSAALKSDKNSDILHNYNSITEFNHEG